MDKINVIEAHDDYGTDIIRAEDGTITSAALILLGKRVAEGHWYFYPDDSQEIAEKIIEDNDGKAAWRFLYNRRDHEYEWVEAREV